MCTAPIALPESGPAPVVCPRPWCRSAAYRERLCDTALMDGCDWLDVPQVAESTGLAPTSVARVLARLERRGWVDSQASESPQRLRSTSRAYRLTSAGVEMARKLADRPEVRTGAR